MIVVTGATGNIGRPLTQALSEAGQQVTAVSRHTAEPPQSGRHVVAGLAEPAGLEQALAGAKSLFLLLSGDLHAAEANPADIIGQAAAAGVRRVVLLSSLGVATRPFGTTRIAMRELEDVVRNSGLDWAILRPGGFASNALWWAESVRSRRMVAAPFGDTGVPIIDPADIAASCLLDDRHLGGVYELTGPELSRRASRRRFSPPLWARRCVFTRSLVRRPRRVWRGACRRSSRTTRWTSLVPLLRPSCA